MIGRERPRPQGSAAPKKPQFPGLLNLPKTARNYVRGGSVARARNACRKLSTGMIRSPCAYLSRLLRRSPQPARGRRPHPRARADRLLLHAADRPDGAVRVDRAGRGDPVAVVDVAAELLHQIEREGEPGRGAADAVGVDPDRERELRLLRLRDADPDQGALLVAAGRRPSSRSRCACPSASRTASRTTSPGLVLPHRVEEAARACARACRRRRRGCRWTAASRAPGCRTRRCRSARRSSVDLTW